MNLGVEGGDERAKFLAIGSKLHLEQKEKKEKKSLIQASRHLLINTHQFQLEEIGRGAIMKLNEPGSGRRR